MQLCWKCQQTLNQELAGRRCIWAGFSAFDVVDGGCDKCAEWARDLATLLGQRHVSPQVLFPHGMDLGKASYTAWAGELHPYLRALGQMASSTSTASRVALLLCTALSVTWPAVALPSVSQAHRILRLGAAFQQTLDGCSDAKSELLAVGPGPLSCLCLATGCVARRLCPTAMLHVAVTVPVALISPGITVGTIVDSVHQHLQPHLGPRIITIKQQGARRAKNALCCISVNNRYFEVTLQDSVAAARAMPVGFSSLRASLRASLPRGGLQHWPRDLDTPRVQQSFTHSEFERLRALLSASLADPAAVFAWIRFLASVPPRSTAAQAVRQHAVLLPLLTSAHAHAVKRVLALAALPQPDLRVPACVVYALVSPLWGKCYVGASGLKTPRPPIDRWMEHVGRARLWQSTTSRTRYGQRCPPLYAAMGSVSPNNVCFVVLEVTTQQQLAQRERHYIRQLEPVFNVVGTTGNLAPWGEAAASLEALTCDELFTLGDRLLRQAHPRLRPSAWAGVIAAMAAAGQRTVAVQLARVARTVCPNMRTFRALPCMVAPCPLPQELLGHLSIAVRDTLRLLPVFARLPQFHVSVRTGRVCWSKSPTVDFLVAPSRPPLDQIGECQCQGWHANRWEGHVLTRSWDQLPPCNALHQLVGLQCLAQRTYPTAQYVCSMLEGRVVRFLTACGFDTELAEEHATRVLAAFYPHLERWLCGLPGYLQQRAIRSAVRRMWRAGLVAVRIDRNPGRVIVLCKEAWLRINKTCFMESPRYNVTALAPAADTPDFAKIEVDDYKRWMEVVGIVDSFRTVPQATRPYGYGYWLIKQKTRLAVGENPKLRPIISHCRHPCRNALARVGRALALLVEKSIEVVQEARPRHTPMWGLHKGSSQWCQQLLQAPEVSCLAEFDVADCFLNTPREAVLGALGFWLAQFRRRNVDGPWFAVSREGKAGDHMGKPCSMHYWALSGPQVRTAVEWELECNASFEVVTATETRVLQQVRGLPIGGHFSAALVELVALHRELTIPWPARLTGLPTARYRDNFFVAFPEAPTRAACEEMAAELSGLLQMPVKFESTGNSIRVLELRITLEHGVPPRVLLAFRTDADRQGESGDVTSWPPLHDPRVQLVLPGLLQGLAAKVRLYHVPGTTGYTATLRRALAFVRQRGYPTRWWVRAFAMALLRHGAAVDCLPRLLRTAAGGCPASCWQSQSGNTDSV